MATIYGSLVGTPKQNTPFTAVDQAYERCFDEVLVRDTIVLNATANGTLIQAIAGLGWESVLEPNGCKAFWGVLGAGVTLSFGDVTFPTALDNAVDVHAAGNALLMSAVAITKYYQPLWQILGYATLAAAQAVAQQCTLIFTLGGANTAAGNQSVVWRLSGARRT